jgi:hypothetical protein
LEIGTCREKVRGKAEVHNSGKAQSEKVVVVAERLLFFNVLRTWGQRAALEYYNLASSVGDWVSVTPTPFSSVATAAATVAFNLSYDRGAARLIVV